MNIEINGVSVALHATTLAKIRQIASERKITIPEAISFLLQKVK